MSTEQKTTQERQGPISACHYKLQSIVVGSGGRIFKQLVAPTVKSRDKYVHARLLACGLLDFFTLIPF